MADNNRRRWIKFDQGLTLALCLAAWAGQVLFYLMDGTRRTAFLIIPLGSLLVLVLMSYLATPLSRLLSSTPVGARVASADEGGCFRLGALCGAGTATVLLGLIGAAALKLPWGLMLFLVVWAYLLSLPLSIVVIVVGIIRARRIRARATVAPEAALEPIQPGSLFDPLWPNRFDRQPARPETWRESWPDDPVIIDLRDRFNRVLRYYCDWPAEAFLPDDDFLCLLEFFDANECGSDRLAFMEELMERFDFIIPDEWLQEALARRPTYLDFLGRLKRDLPPDYAQRLDAVYGRPLALPDNYYVEVSRVRRRFPLTGQDRENHDRLRRFQVLRSPHWRDQWAGEEFSAELRDRVGRMLAGRFHWLDEAFLPGDRLNAILHTCRGLKKMPQAVTAINGEFGAGLTMEEVVADGLTFLDLLRRINTAVRLNSADGRQRN